uniref:Uncharacterized protein n=1 Tax=Candidatus Kentrum sp. TC TaxID=2126339 RepID=A0A450Y7V0_9GAMM|nr:MAG: hypothetical protein BECKTC1821D_GA0114238_100192 [Candidatus Kentron sp. TC]VFK37601.1 MAG: hypothetical protein BECKTC1821E_GA0114239_100128 [Candidatus Kentron sp. TC]VFK51854.1 MAG: hypothetical protein BECKTC1821F_GA0114240_1001149 [Candidatus Kentron sp. TC]
MIFPNPNFVGCAIPLGDRYYSANILLMAIPNPAKAETEKVIRKSRGFETRYTFSTSGCPNKPVGRNINTNTRIENAATSLYSVEK